MNAADINRVSSAVGVRVSAEDAKALARWVPGSEVRTRIHPYPSAVILDTTGPGGFEASSAVVQVDSSRPTLVNLRIVGGEGQGVMLFGQQAVTAKGLGIKAVLTTAGGEQGSWMRGYYAWPRMGFDGRIPDGPWRKMSPEAKAIAGPERSLLKVMAWEEGRAFWRLNGKAVDLWFDLAEGSPNWLAFRAYLAERRARHGQ